MRSYGKPFRRKVRGRLSAYYSVLIYENGRRWRRSTKRKSLKEARAVIDRWRQEDGDLSLDAPKTFLDATDRFIESKIGRTTPGRIAAYRSLRKMWSVRWPTESLAQISVQTVQQYMNIRKATGRSHATLNSELAAIRAVFRFSQRQGWISRNPASLVPLYWTVPRAIVLISPEQETRLLQSARMESDVLYGALLCLIYTGLRRGCVASLTWDDVNIKSGEWQIPADKMKSRQPFVGKPIAGPLLRWLRKHRSTNGSLIFGPISRIAWSHIITRASMPKLKVHDLRRHFVTKCRRLGIKMEVAMALSDHRNVKVFLECYRAISPKELRDAVRLIETDDRPEANGTAIAQP